LVLRPSVFSKAIGKNLDELRPGPLGAGIEVRIDAAVREGQASNVLGKIEGTDPNLRNEWVVLSAHYDHIGAHEVPAGQDGVWNGADDNASGTAAVLELARRLARHPGKRSVLVFFTSGEDRGILGSAYYASQPLVPMDRVAVQINLDMIGRSEGKVQVIADNSQPLYEQAVQTAQAHGIEVIPDQQPTWRLVYLTDAYHFARSGIPYAFFFTGTHPDYHQPSDTADKIRYEELERIVETAADMTRFYAEGGARPRSERPKWFVTP
jgi:Zn-dependent M28 family amino/carboxypeptidase